MGKQSRAPASASSRGIPEFSPRHPKHQSEQRRVANLLARDDAERQASTALVADLAQEREVERRAMEGRETPHYERRVSDKPPIRAGYEIVNPDDPRQKQRYKAKAPPTHPLFKALRKIGEPRFRAGNIYRQVYEASLDAPGRDSTQALNVKGGGSAREPARSAAQVTARKWLAGIEIKLHRSNYAILKKFCGEGRSMADAVHSTVTCHRDGVLDRVNEALDHLLELGVGKKDFENEFPS